MWDPHIYTCICFTFDIHVIQYKVITELKKNLYVENDLHVLTFDDKS